MDEEDWDETLYKNWVRGAKGLEFLQEGLNDFVGSKAPECRDQLLKKVTKCPRGPLPQCNLCTSQNLLPEHADSKQACNRSSTCVQRNSSNCFGSRPRGRRKCPNGICSKLYDAIVSDHCFNDPLWKNTDLTTWCSDPQAWSFAKCFETTPGPATSAQETDASGLLSILLNNRSMQNWLACHNMGLLNATCPYFKARYIRNEILHKAKMELEDLTLDEYIDTFITILEDPKCLMTHTGSQDAVKKLKKLKSKQINITQKDEKDILKIRKEALSELKDRTEDSLQEINKAKEGALHGIEEETSTGLTAMSGKRRKALKKIEDITSSGITAISEKRTGVLKEIDDKTNAGLFAMSAERTGALKEIEDTTNSTKAGISEKTTEALTKIEDMACAELTVMSEKMSDALTVIEDTSKTGLTVISSKKTEALREIADTVCSGLAEVEDTTRSGLASISEKTTEALTEIKDVTRSELTEALGKIDGRGQRILSEVEGAFKELKNRHIPIETVAGKDRQVTSLGAHSGTTIPDDDDSESESKKTKAVLDKAWGKLMDYMNPDPILKCATEYDLFGYRQTRTISVNISNYYSDSFDRIFLDHST